MGPKVCPVYAVESLGQMKLDGLLFFRFNVILNRLLHIFLFKQHFVY